MKVKSAHATAGIGSGHSYLGHFAKPHNINRGHNTDPMNEEVVPPKSTVLPGDKATVAEMDENMAKVKARESNDRAFRNIQADREIIRKTDAYGEQLRKEERKRQARGQ